MQTQSTTLRTGESESLIGYRKLVLNIVFPSLNLITDTQQ